MSDNSDNIKKVKKLSNTRSGRRTRIAKFHKRNASHREVGEFSMFFSSETGVDPEMLYVECEKCGAPVLWSEGRALHILHEAGIDPLELDESCILLTDGCPACGMREEYSVRIFRSGIRTHFIPVHGHA